MVVGAIRRAHADGVIHTAQMVFTQSEKEYIYKIFNETSSTPGANNETN